MWLVLVFWSFFFFTEFFGWYWLIKLYRFQVYSSVTHDLYIVLCVHHPESILPSPLISPFILSYLPHPLPSGNNPHTVVCVCEFCFVLLNFFTFLTQLPNLPPLWQLSACSLWVCLSFVCWFILFIRFHMSKIIWYLSFSDWLISFISSLIFMFISFLC